MGRILVDKKELEKIKSKRIIDSGKEGTCYFRKEDNVVIKIYKTLDKSRKVYFDTLSSPSISFPIDILMGKETEMIVGYTMPFFPGQKVINGFSSDLGLKELKESYLAISKVISDYKDIYMYDLCLANIFFDNSKNQFSLIDTSRWYPVFNSSKGNLEMFDKSLMAALCRGNFSWLNEYLNKSPALFSMYRLYKQGLPISILEFLDALILEVDMKFGVKARTISDLTPKMYKKLRIDQKKN